MFTNFAPRHSMFAQELAHTQSAPLPLHIATLVTTELGEPSFRKNNDCAWYADAHIDLDDGSQVTCPFALRIDRNGNAMLTVRWQETDLMAHALATLVPNIYVEPVERGHRRAA